MGANKGLGEAPKSCTRKEHESATNSIAKRGQGGDFVPFRLPLAGSRDSVPCGVWGNAPTVPRATSMPNALNKGAGSEASLPVTLRIRRCAPNLLYLPLAHCRAKWARPTSIERNGSLAAGLFCCMGFASAEATRGLCGRPLDCFASTSKRLDFSCCRDFAPASATRGLCGRPLDPFALALRLLLYGSVYWEEKRYTN